MIEYLREGNKRSLVLVDTSVWVASVRRPKSAVADELRLLLERDEAATTDVVIGEVLQGARSEEDYADWSSRLDALHFFASELDVWLRASHTSFELRTKGMTTPLADVVIATVALDNDLLVYAIDDHFDRVPGLHLYRPSNYEVRNRGKDKETKEE